MKNEINRNALGNLKKFNFDKRSFRGKVHVSDHQLTNALKIIRSTAKYPQENHINCNHDNTRHGTNHPFQYGRNIFNGVKFHVNIPRNAQCIIKEKDQETMKTSSNYGHFNPNSTAFVYNKFNIPNGSHMSNNQYSLKNDQFAQEKKSDSQKMSMQNNNTDKVLTISTMINKYNGKKSYIKIIDVVEEESHKKKILTNMLAYEIGCHQAMMSKGMKFGQGFHPFPVTSQNVNMNMNMNNMNIIPNRLKYVKSSVNLRNYNNNFIQDDGKEYDNRNFFTISNSYSENFKQSKLCIDILKVNINLGKEIKCINVRSNDDYYQISKAFCEENNLPDKLVKPIALKIMITMSSLNHLFNIQLNEEEMVHLRNIKDLYLHSYGNSSHSQSHSHSQSQSRSHSCESSSSLNEREERESNKSFS